MKKKIVMICCTVFALSLAGCSDRTNTGSEVIQEKAAVEEETQESDLSKDASKIQEAIDNTESKMEQSDSGMAIGQVSAIDGDTITVVLGEMSIDGGERPTGDAPTGDAPTGDAPAGEAPTGESPAAAPFTASDESITITFEGTVAIQLMADGEITEGSIDDIAIDDILSIAYDDSGALASVQIMNQGPGGSKRADAGTSDKASEAQTYAETQNTGE